MTLTILAHEVLRGNGPLKQKIADAAGVSSNTVYFWLRTNSENLTRAAVIECLMRETGLKYEQVLDRGEGVQDRVDGVS
jgi:hypothetical protein